MKTKMSDFEITDEIIDQSIIIYFKAPYSFTREDVIEFQCHGGIISSSQIIDACLKEGAKLLLKEIHIVKPRLILLLGNSAIKAFSYLPLKNAKQVKNYKRNSINEFDFLEFKTKIGVTFHPSPISFNRKNIRQDLEKFFMFLEV